MTDTMDRTDSEPLPKRASRAQKNGTQGAFECPNCHRYVKSQRGLTYHSRTCVKVPKGDGELRARIEKLAQNKYDLGVMELQGALNGDAAYDSFAPLRDAVQRAVTLFGECDALREVLR